MTKQDREYHEFVYLVHYMTPAQRRRLLLCMVLLKMRRRFLDFWRL